VITFYFLQENRSNLSKAASSKGIAYI